MGAAEVGALVTDASWGRANAPMAKRRTAENFIVMLGRIEALRYYSYEYIEDTISECGEVRVLGKITAKKNECVGVCTKNLGQVT
jgi:hypothetical protein